MARAEPLITPAIFKFLRDLKRNNDREWFNANKQRYIQQVRDPLLAFIVEFAPRLERISPLLRADARPVGGSLFRIYRDTRFSRDKSPYKTHAGVHFRHEAGKDAHAPGRYLHLEPGSAFAALGVWHPDGEALQQIRETIVESPDRFTRAVSRRGIELGDGERLKRPPRGFDPDHPLIEDLKRKTFTASRSFSQTEACSPQFPQRLAQFYRNGAPMMEFLANAVGLEF